MKSNTALAVLVSLLAGAIIGYSFKLSGNATSPSGSAPISTSDYDEGIRKLQDLSENEIAEYYRLKTMEERYAKADELLGKMMTIFLADLGIKLTTDTKVAMDTPLLPTSDAGAVAPRAAQPSAGTFRVTRSSLKELAPTPEKSLDRQIVSHSMTFAVKPR